MPPLPWDLAKVDLPPYDEELHQVLRRLRAELAAAAGLPAYIILQDHGLLETTAALPRSMQELSMVKGWGPRRLAEYGDRFLEAIASYLDRGPSKER